MFGSEDDFLALIDRYFPRDDGMLVGRGDDCAVFSCPQKMCVTSDLFIEDVHFRRHYFSPFDIGYKSLAVNLSDIAAMGAKPLAFSLSLAFPTDIDAVFWSDFFSGMATLASRYGVILSGGDLSRADKILINITVWGDCSAAYCQRGNCSVGDKIVLVGQIGLARTGFLLLEAGIASRQFSQAAAAHLRPEPLLEAGQKLASFSGVKSMMDISDGLVRDLPRLLGGKFGAEIDADALPIEQVVLERCAVSGQNPFEFALVGGEDYALAAVVAADSKDDLSVLAGKIIGTVCETPGLFLHGKPFVGQGFDHFG